MKYISLIPGTNTVAEIIPEENPALPGFSLEDRYPPDFVAALIPLEDDTDVAVNWVYDADSKTFSVSPEPEPSLTAEPETERNVTADTGQPTFEERLAALESKNDGVEATLDAVLTGLETLYDE